VDPVSLRAGVVEDGWLPHVARAMAHAVQPGPSREAEASARAQQGFREFQAAGRTIQGYEAMNIIRKGQVRWLRNRYWLAAMGDFTAQTVLITDVQTHAEYSKRR
jgi:hypothetical protein